MENFVTIKDGEVIIMTQDGTNLSEKIISTKKEIKKAKFYCNIFSYAFLTFGILWFLGFFDILANRQAPFFCASFLLGIITIIHNTTIEETHKSLARYEKKLNLAHKELEDDILQAKKKLAMHNADLKIVEIEKNL